MGLPGRIVGFAGAVSVIGVVGRVVVIPEKIPARNVIHIAIGIIDAIAAGCSICVT